MDEWYDTVHARDFLLSNQHIALQRKWGVHGLAVHGLHLFHVSSLSLFYYSSFIQAYVDYGRIGLHHGWDWCLSWFIMVPPQTRTFERIEVLVEAIPG
jgi:hypothetical protein